MARRLLARARAPNGPGSDCHDPIGAADQAFRALARELSRWFGPYAYNALFARAFAETRNEHAALAATRVRSATEPWLEGLAEAASSHGADATTEALSSLLAAIVDLLGRLIGADMAVSLVARAMTNGEPDPEADFLTDSGGAT